MTEFLLFNGLIERRYDEQNYHEEVLAPWRPLVAQLMERPGDRLYHGLVGLPYWEASMCIPKRMAHPDLALCQWLSFYASPRAREPYYIGSVITSENQASAVDLVFAAGGSPSRSEHSRHEIMAALPALAGTYNMAAMPLGFESMVPQVQATGECACILATLIVQALS